MIFLEVDEDGHESYNLSCELRRVMDVHRSLVLEGNTLPVAFIRYNPNAFKVDGKTKRTSKYVREKALVDAMRNWEFKRDFEILYMYYDEDSSAPSILSDPEYDESVKELVRL